MKKANEKIKKGYDIIWGHFDNSFTKKAESEIELSIIYI